MSLNDGRCLPRTGENTNQWSRTCSAFQRWSIPWFAIHGHISQNPIHEYTGSALLAPFLLWLYMLMAQIGMLNLLIAVMTDTYFKVGDKKISGLS